MSERYFNENDAYAAQWLRNLWPGAIVDERSIVAVQPGDLARHRRVHLFAGIGGWEYALQLADWPDDEEVWTGSCPCQPFSGAGRHDGVLDERHLWPAFHRLIAECHPAIVFGEQVASAAGRAWLAGVRTDLEDLGYAVGAADLCAASLGAPHIRQRLYWVAESAESRRGEGPGRHGGADGRPASEPRRLRDALGLADRSGARLAGRPEQSTREERSPTERGGDAGRLGDPTSRGRGEQRDAPRERRSRHAEQSGGTGSRAGGLADPDGGHTVDREESGVREHGQQPEDGRPRFWDAYDLLPCRDGKARRVEPGTFPLAHGVPARVGRLRAYGNAIVPHVAAEFVRAWRDAAG